MFYKYCKLNTLGQCYINKGSRDQCNTSLGSLKVETAKFSLVLIFARYGLMCTAVENRIGKQKLVCFL
jgi:hypothetical protein